MEYRTQFIFVRSALLFSSLTFLIGFILFGLISFPFVQKIFNEDHGGSDAWNARRLLMT
jgi:hypothetical protein